MTSKKVRGVNFASGVGLNLFQLKNTSNTTTAIDKSVIMTCVKEIGVPLSHVEPYLPNSLNHSWIPGIKSMRL